MLHDRSFVDDPTRMLRLVRYAARLEFAPDPDTAALVDPALLATVTGDRARQRAAAAAARAAARAARCSTRSGWAARCSASGFAVTWLAERAGPGLLALAACCTAIPREQLAARLDHLGFARQDRE